MSILAILLAVFLHLGDGLSADRSVVAILKALVTLMRMTSRAFAFAIVGIISRAIFDTLGVQVEIAMLVLL